MTDAEDGGPALTLSAEIAAIAAHPNLPLAIRTMAEGALSMYRRRPILNRVLNDRGRVAVSYIALYLHYTGSGLTTNRFKQTCAQAGFGSPGRAVAMLALMRFAGMLIPAEATQRGQRQRLLPSDSFMELQLERMRIGLASLSHVAPEGTIGLARLKEPGFTGNLVRHIGEALTAGAQPLRYAPRLGFFFDRNSGITVLLALTLAGAPGDTLPPTGPLPVSIADLARRFAVSRAHVARVLAAAEEEGLLQRDPSAASSYRMTQALREAMVTFTAALLLLLARSTAAAIAAQDSAQHEAA